jgi:hypothetical protein
MDDPDRERGAQVGKRKRSMTRVIERGCEKEVRPQAIRPQPPSSVGIRESRLAGEPTPNDATISAAVADETGESGDRGECHRTGLGNRTADHEPAQEDARSASQLRRCETTGAVVHDDQISERLAQELAAQGERDHVQSVEGLAVDRATGGGAVELLGELPGRLAAGGVGVAVVVEVAGISSRDD